MNNADDFERGVPGHALPHARPQPDASPLPYRLFGMCRMLGLTLSDLRVLKLGRKWKHGILKASFRSLTLGLIFMVVRSMFPTASSISKR